MSDLARAILPKHIAFNNTVFGFDIDDTITRKPEYFSALSRQVHENCGKIYIVSSRSDLPEVKEHSIKELQKLNIYFDDIYLLPGYELAKEACPHNKLDWYQKYLWQKVRFCLDHDVQVFFDDDSKVVELFRQYAPKIEIYHVQ